MYNKNIILQPRFVSQQIMEWLNKFSDINEFEDNSNTISKIKDLTNATNAEQNKYGIYANYVIIYKDNKIFPIDADLKSAIEIYLNFIKN